MSKKHWFVLLSILTIVSLTMAFGAFYILEKAYRHHLREPVDKQVIAYIHQPVKVGKLNVEVILLTSEQVWVRLSKTPHRELHLLGIPLGFDTQAAGYCIQVIGINTTAETPYAVLKVVANDRSSPTEENTSIR